MIALYLIYLYAYAILIYDILEILKNNKKELCDSLI